MKPAIATWTTSQIEEDRMNDGHFHHWQTMLRFLETKELNNKRILDYGCNQGGFLRTLYDAFPFKSAVGIDIAEASLQVAEGKSASLPIKFQTLIEFENKKYEGSFDLAFSHEVIYLLPDLDSHAKLISKVLKPSGTYYAAVGCYTENPLWKLWRGSIQDYSNIPVPDYSINNYIDAFQKNNFSVSYRPFGIHDFVKYEEDDAVYFPSVFDKIDYYQNNKILFKFSKK